MRWKLVAGAVASLTALPVALTASAEAAPTGPYHAEIRRTSYGIPHIKAADYGGLGFGHGYAFAQDNLCVMASRLVTLSGERSRYFRPDAQTDDPLTRTTNLASDVYNQAELRSDAVRRLIAQPAPLGPTREVRDLVRGYVAGYNRYLRDTGVSRLPDPTCRGAAWVRPMTELDVYRDLYHVTQLEGAQQAIQQIATATPPSAGRTARAKVPVLPKADAGSNAYGLGRDATRGKGGMVLADGTYPDVQFGSSFIMAVSLTPAGPRASTILTYSESANPTSPHHTDQTRLFSQKQWVLERFTDTEIAAEPQYRTTRVTG
ncbi:hypothetical protein GCM10023196_083700 [Actinoallomurus vinaceus]|uniref:Acylase n=1 Tax=Actinoallomurus vinaceus TaxID=1080074 RepID=A0ABP8USC5_9ACTN